MAIEQRTQNDDEPPVSYEDWYETQCNIGYDVDEDWLCELADDMTNEVSKSNKMGIALDAYVFAPRSTKFKPNRQTLEWSIGHYLGDSNIVWEVTVDLGEVPDDSPLRTQYPLAFDAFKHGYMGKMHVDIINRHTHPRHEVNWEPFVSYLIGDTVTDESIYGGMPLEDYEDIAEQQVSDLSDFVGAVCEQAYADVTSVVYGDYEWFFSEDRYKQEIEA